MGKARKHWLDSIIRDSVGRELGVQKEKTLTEKYPGLVSALPAPTFPEYWDVGIEQKLVYSYWYNETPYTCPIALLTEGSYES